MTQPQSLSAFLAEQIPHIFVLDFSRYMIAVSLVAGVVWLLSKTSWASRKIQAREATRADFKREFTSSIRTVAVYVVAMLPFIWLINTGVIPTYQGDYGWSTYALYLAAIVLVHDAYFYWTHRAMHHPRLFKNFHLHHHKTVTPTAWTAYSFDVGEAFVMVAFMPIWLTLVPTPNGVIFTFLAVMILRNAMGHAGLELHPRGWASHPVLKWISTTTHHDMHHGGSFKHNFGFYFTFWDKLMGTEHPEYVATFDRVTGAKAKAATDIPAKAESPQVT